MVFLPPPNRLAALALGLLLACEVYTSRAEEPELSPCIDDAMIVFDASGSMAGNGWGYGSESANTVSRIDKVRSVLATILPRVTRFRRVGLITFGPGPYDQCNVQLAFEPRRIPLHSSWVP